ncbi:hypothetical protein M0G43_13365 [Subsaxibacter sp. CAU 1640]|uniref:hypothetical protein n=1 Tax=Subsaxibacter sp. CAU 1640 TaxID=2933271 RepID=UPI002005B226|nr:hypothetical protein [Subsaxibacter sp. CAU 1640]MCK7591570.1 hypothetical protein [Subsaxibacter sp. CAU 1640]
MMTHFNPHVYLGLHIADLDKPVSLNFQDPSGKSYHLLDDNVKSLFGLHVKNIFIKTNNDGIIISISTYFPQILEDKVYEEMVDTYGEPHSVLKEDTTTLEKEFLSDNSEATSLRQQSLVEVALKDHPILLVWQYNDVQIVVTNNSKNNSLKILFTDISMSVKS